MNKRIGEATAPPHSPRRGVANILTFYPLAPRPEFRRFEVVNKSVRNEMRKIGYARVSTPTQNFDRQIGALRAERCDKTFREKASGKDIKNRPQLEKAIDELGKGDVLVLAEWDRATRSMLDGVHIIERIPPTALDARPYARPRGACGPQELWPRPDAVALLTGVQRGALPRQRGSSAP